MTSLTLWIVLVLLNLCGRHCEITVEQVPFVFGMVHTTVNLDCKLNISPGSTYRTHPYWVLYKPNDQSKTLLYPSENIPFLGRVKLSNEKDVNDMSISFSNLQLNDTNIYECFVSLWDGQKSISKSGHQTQLYVHGPLQIDYNGTAVQCKIQVYKVENLTFIWYNEHRDRLNEYEQTMKLQEPQGSYWIISVLTVKWDRYKAKRNQTISCLLQHNSGHVLIIQSMEIDRKGYESAAKITSVSCQCNTKQPVLLYSLVLGSSFLILLIILVFSLKKRYFSSPLRRHKVNIPHTSAF